MKEKSEAPGGDRGQHESGTGLYDTPILHQMAEFVNSLDPPTSARPDLDGLGFAVAREFGQVPILPLPASFYTPRDDLTALQERHLAGMHEHQALAEAAMLLGDVATWRDHCLCFLREASRWEVQRWLEAERERAGR